MAELNITNLREFVEQKLNGTDCFLVKAELLKNNEIVVEIDSDTRVDIDFVATLNREIEEHFAPAIDDYTLEVGSVGLTTPLTLPRQYRKNRGNDLEVLTADGKKLHGMLRDADDEGITLVIEEKVKREGEKRPVMQETELRLPYGDMKRAVYDLKF